MPWIFLAVWWFSRVIFDCSGNLEPGGVPIYRLETFTKIAEFFECQVCCSEIEDCTVELCDGTCVRYQQTPWSPDLFYLDGDPWNPRDISVEYEIPDPPMNDIRYLRIVAEDNAGHRSTDSCPVGSTD
jgi:hypothetical protein